MVAPTGARRTKADHPKIPIMIDEIVACARACFEAGAGGLHAHVRDAAGAHVLDAGLYLELIAEMAQAVPEMQVQITTEAVGRYSPDEQRRLVRDVMPKSVSVALREMIPVTEDVSAASEFYHWAADEGVQVQHILYDAEDLGRLIGLLDSAVLPAGNIQLLFVLGRYTVGQQSAPEDLDPFLSLFEGSSLQNNGAEWALCAFGSGETDCLLAALSRGGKARIGFENSLWNRDGAVAEDNVERIRELVSLAGK
ncbi:3-keto-5-aminohexanoate cleavage protein [Hoeflea sp. WL0058]|uniref:3-keto-5-aminohexanoate cleavage protein n=2 Tax=Flavimaribacter sediminis TaxID=2865987 RepID=A0AAE3D1C6_9HYPH|nr:3-keto-5-aminohexanoate cleavage protein [Flavimaribacter sediminis]